jgi:hypothetical protein
MTRESLGASATFFQIHVLHLLNLLGKERARRGGIKEAYGM